MIFRIILAISLIAISLMSFSQQLSPERQVDWSVAGVKQFNEPPTLVNFLQAGGIADGTTPNETAFADIVNSLAGAPAVIYFPAGEYFFSKPLEVPAHVILRGVSSDSTEFIFDIAPRQDHLIKVSGSATGIVEVLSADAAKDSTFVELNSPGTFAAGDYLMVLEDDSLLVTSSWGNNTTGQIVRVWRAETNRLYLEDPLRRSFTVSNNVRVRKLNLTEDAGIENLKITRRDATAQQTSNIWFQYAANCRVSCVESANSNFAHVEISNSTNIEVSGSYFHGAHAYGGGGQGYGVMLHFTSGACLIENNVFDTLRHSMILQAGANGNVLAYNYSNNPYWTGVSLPANSAGDMVLHGNYPYANLFEGNVVQHIVIDDSHGKNGPNNTFLRNRAELYGLFMNFNPPSDGQNFIGNEITNNGMLMGNYLLSGSGHYEYGNNKNGSTLPAGTEHVTLQSLYLTQLPAYYTDGAPIGYPNAIKEQTIPAQQRYNEAIWSACEYVIEMPDTAAPATDTTVAGAIDSTTNDTTGTVGITQLDNFDVQVYPNPASGQVVITIPAGTTNAGLQLFELSGKIVLSCTLHVSNSPIDIADLTPGVYIYQVQLPGQVRRGKLVVR